MDRRENVIEDITGPITVTFTVEDINIVVDVNVTACYETGRSIICCYTANKQLTSPQNRTKLLLM